MPAQDNAAIINAAITDAQHAAAVCVIAPAMMSDPYSQAAADEWNMLKPLAASFATANAPKTAFAYPLLFSSWLLANTSASAKNYVSHIVTYANQNSTAVQATIAREPSIAEGLVALNQAGVAPKKQ
jgi:hypothetical protein